MVRRPDTPCSGCGKLLYSGSGSLPAELRRCHGCRRASPRTPQKRPPIECEHPACDVIIESPTSRQRWCSKTCCDRGPHARPRNHRKNRRRRSDSGHTSAGWARLRAQVLREEKSCWYCGQGFSPRHAWPHRLSPTADHVLPLEGGGALLDRANVRAAHRECNQKRHTEWRRDQRAARRAELGLS